MSTPVATPGYEANGLRSSSVVEAPYRVTNSSVRVSTSTPFPARHMSAMRPSTSMSQRSTSFYQSSMTPGRRSRAASSAWGGEQHQVVCAISEARGVSPTVGLALINISTNEAIICEICDTQFYFKTITKLQAYFPRNILMSSVTPTPGQYSKLAPILEHDPRLSQIPIEELDRKYWSETAGLEYIKSLAFKEDLEAIEVAIQSHFYATSAFAALVIVPQQASIVASEIAIDNVLSIKSFVLNVKPLFESLMGARSSLLVRIRDLCRSEIVQPVIDLIRDTIKDDVTSMKTPLDRRNQRSFAVKTGVHGLLDVARQTYKEGTEDVYQLVDDINKSHETDAEVKFDERRCFWLRLRRADFESKPLPDIFINVTTRGIWYECQTISLIQLSNRVTDSHNEAVMLSDQVVQDLIGKILDYVPSLFRMCEGIGLLDMLTAFCQTATVRDYVRPEMNDTMALKHARHPICERVNPEKFVPNDVFANEQHRFQIITGCNMSGKSTYIRMVALIQVMAQMGSFVPAEYAAVPIIHQLFVRMSTDDNIEANMSTFSLEMREMAFILRNVDRTTLAIVDELGRATSTRDGLAIALAISEALLQSGSTVWFATHFHQLARILGSRPGVLNLHLSATVSNTNDQDSKMTMLYKVNSGIVQKTRYGLNLARAIGLPERFIDVAENVAKRLETENESKKQKSEHQRLFKRRRLILNLEETLSQLQTTDMENDVLRSYLEKLQGEFVQRMEAIDSSSNSAN
ncbi:DNA mismatch repair protein MSH4 [Microdochium nivale]|nr:DNA mismatch repair protein MSH4 [Microdochium nivale]